MTFEKRKPAFVGSLILAIMTFLLLLLTFVSLACAGIQFAVVGFGGFWPPVVLCVIALGGWMILTAILWDTIRKLRSELVKVRAFPLVDPDIGEQFATKERKVVRESDEIKPE